MKMITVPWNAEEYGVLRRLTTPAKVQDFLNRLDINFQKKALTCRSPRRTLRERTAHCLEGAMLAAAAFSFYGEPPLLLDLKSGRGDDDHVVALFRRHGKWGAVGKTNHAVLRYREPVYRDVRELAMSFFHEYFLDDGRKTMKSWSDPLDLRKFAKRGWMTDEKDLWYVVRALDRLPHHRILARGQERELRRADEVEIRAGKVTEQG